MRSQKPRRLRAQCLRPPVCLPACVSDQAEAPDGVDCNFKPILPEWRDYCTEVDRARRKAGTLQVRVVKGRQHRTGRTLANRQKPPLRETHHLLTGTICRPLVRILSDRRAEHPVHHRGGADASAGHRHRRLRPPHALDPPGTPAALLHAPAPLHRENRGRGAIGWPGTGIQVGSVRVRVRQRPRCNCPPGRVLNAPPPCVCSLSLYIASSQQSSGRPCP